MIINLKKALTEDVTLGLKAANEKYGWKIDKTDLPTVIVTHSQGAGRGDYASPVALSLAKKTGLNPMEVVEKIAEQMLKKEYVGKLEAAAPGFLNIWINPGWMTARLDDMIEQNMCGLTGERQAKRYNLEFISANPTGPITLGNARTAFSVDTLGRVLECAGDVVVREYYINDGGEQVRKLGESVLRRILQAQGEKVEYPEEMYQGEYIKDVGAVLAEQLREDEGKEYEPGDLDNAEVIGSVGDKAAAMLMNKIKQMITDALRIKFDVWTSEKTLRASGKVDAVRKLLEEKGALYEKEGAVYLKTTTQGDSEDRIFVKSNGAYAYIAPDVAYHVDKYERGFDEIFTFVGADHQGHGPKLAAALKMAGFDTNKLHVVAAQWMQMVQGGKSVKLSKRKGVLYTPAELIDEVGYDAARFFMVQHALTTHMEFDLDLAKERSERNPVYYVQYAYVRIQSILRRAKEGGLVEGIGEGVRLSSHSKLTYEHELEVLRRMYEFREVVDDIAETLEVHRLPYYAVELARSVHAFYRNVPVLAEENEEVRRGRLQLVLGARKVLGQTLDLLGISKPEVM